MQEIYRIIKENNYEQENNLVKRSTHTLQFRKNYHCNKIFSKIC